MRTIQDMVQHEVLCCVSSLVSTLASGYGVGLWDGNAAARAAGNDLPDLCEQAFELASPIPDYEEAAIQEGFHHVNGEWQHEEGDCTFATAEDACSYWDIEPYDREVYEHWAVTDWFADKLIAQGEKVDKDFAGLCVWARTTTGHAIHADAVIERIYAETHK